MRSDNQFDTELLVAIIALLIFIAMAASTGCASHRSAPEPAWMPNIYLYASQDGRCLFVNGAKDKIDCDEPRIHDVFCAPLEDLKTLKEKMQRCEVWK